MRQQLWQLNSSLLLIFIITLGVSFVVKKQAPFIKFIPAAKISQIVEKPIEEKISLEEIYKKDLFDTYAAAEKPKEEPLFGPIPDPKPPKMVAIPPIKPPEFLAPLDIKLKGILYSSDPDKSVVLLEDETGKELSYYLDDQIKDGQIIKINKEKVIILRSNAQQESIFLRNEDNFLNAQQNERWDGIIKKVNETNYIINPNSFKEKIQTLGQFLDAVDPATIYSQGSPFGVQIGKFSSNDVGVMLGLQEKDVIISINDLNVTSSANRYEVFDAITHAKLNDIIKVQLKRSNQDLTINYKLAYLERKIQKFGSPSPEKPQYIFQMSREQMRSEQKRKFQEVHPINMQELNMLLRQRYLENLNLREKNMRIY
ncbi:TPA: hypothetical protein DEO28_02435 [Candidatus Dependentiae bacterium]|nr:MAG: hypothetical protein UR14_C0008G0023 [candidate division TM6 bacterium GW2011_GWE2_31_21]KKP53251.1 MAG: hypothetical protein UR43_C0006G0034 [candidate division TM6 bacterium GW2011_GWF2_33_332]HBS48050.1 hypothetical protein [Candidatus Dependentiae bacterium]HBZ73347.1 hypothetical protein [Candidatus Dependentiae bacterium]